MPITTINNSTTFNTAYTGVNTNDTVLSNGEKSVLEHLILFDKTFADNYNNTYNAYDTGLYYSGSVSSATDYHLRLSTVTDTDIEQYIMSLDNLDTNNTVGHDDAVTKADIIALVEHTRKVSLNNITTPVNAIKTIAQIQDVFKNGLTGTEENTIKAAVTAFDKLNDSYDVKITARDLRDFARTYGLNADQKEELEDLHPVLGNVFGPAES